MIAVDSSALLAVALSEPEGRDCLRALTEAERLIISAGTLAEALIVAARRGVSQEVRTLITDLRLEIIPVTDVTARQMESAYERWGKGLHPARLNFADCFAYVLAQEFGCRLLYVGNDFAQTDIVSALA